MHLVLALGALRAALGARTDLVLENLALRQQLALLRRRSKRPRFLKLRDNRIQLLLQPRVARAVHSGAGPYARAARLHASPMLR